MRVLIDLQGAQGVNRNHGIGRLTRALARAMIASSGSHEPLILLNDAIPESAEALSEEFATLLPRSSIRFWRGLTNAAATGDRGCIMRRQAAERIRAHSIASIGVDVVHMSSVFEGGSDDTITNWPADLHRPPHFATFYDAIPLINRDQYLRGSWKDQAQWYMKQVHEVRSLDGLLAISESSRREAIEYLHFDPMRVFNIRAGYDSSVFRPIILDGSARQEFLARYDLREGYLLFVGAGDVRKNVHGLLQSYGMLPGALRTRQQLVVVGASDPAALTQCASSLGIHAGDLVMPRYIPEEDLATLYSLCGLFVMPSKHEGFGLPALEAMACGAPVVASNTTSLPEVVGLAEALFDPNDPASMSEHIRAALEDKEFRSRLVEHGRRQAATFTWQESARRAWEGMEQMAARVDRPASREPGAIPYRKPRLALVGGVPAPEQATKSDLDFFLELGAHYEVTLVTSSPLAKDHELGAALPVILLDEFAAHSAHFERILYCIDRIEFLILEELLPTFPGVVWVQKDKLTASLMTVLRHPEDRDRIAGLLFKAQGWRALDALSRNQLVSDELGWLCIPSEALAIIQQANDASSTGRRLAAHCHVTIEAVYNSGPAAQREACAKAIKGADLTQIAHAMVQSFPPDRPQRLLIDVACVSDEGLPKEVGLRQLCRSALIESREDGTIVELVRIEDGMLRFARARAAALLDLPLHGLRDNTVSVSSVDTLVVRAAPTVQGASVDLPVLQSLRRRGIRIVALLLENVAEPPAVLSIADGLICASEELAKALKARWFSIRSARHDPLEVFWPTIERKLLQIPALGRWPSRWPGKRSSE